MKHITLTCICFLLLLSARAQKIHFTDLSNSWIYQYSYPAYNQTQGHHLEIRRLQYGYTNSSMIDGRLFYNLSYHYIYEDTVRNIVYMGDTSHILYNFNWQVGDTFSVPFAGNVRTHTVTRVDTTIINGYPHKVFLINVTNPLGIPYTIIEGIGSTISLFFPWEDASNMYLYQSLVCFSNNYSRPQIEVQFGVNTALNNCDTPFLNVNTLASPGNVTVYPQPATDHLSIQLPSDFHSGTVNFYNLSGQVVYNKELKNNAEIVIGNDNRQGLYLYKIIDNVSGQQYTGKISFQ